MFFLVLGITFALLVYLTIITKHKDKGGYLLALGVLIVSVTVFVLIGSVFNELYYTYGDTIVEQEEVKLHPKCDITLYNYIAQEKVTVMDAEHNLIKIDLKKVDVTFVEIGNRLLRRTQYPKGIFKLFVLEQSHSDYVVELGDWWVEKN